MRSSVRAAARRTRKGASIAMSRKPSVSVPRARRRITRAVSGSGGQTLSNTLRVALARAPGTGDPRKFLAILKALPPGEMTAAEIDREMEEVRGDWGD